MRHAGLAHVPGRPGRNGQNGFHRMSADLARWRVAMELGSEQVEEIKEKVVAGLRTCFDPEIPVNIYELGLIYSIDATPSGAVSIRMTLTSPACPAAGSLPPEVQSKVAAIPGVAEAQVDVVWG